MTQAQVADRIEELYAAFQEAPGAVFNRVAKAELTECERIVAFLRDRVDPSLLEALTRGDHHQ